MTLAVLAVVATTVALTLWMTRNDSRGTPRGDQGSSASVSGTIAQSNTTTAVNEKPLPQDSGVFINERQISPQQVEELRQIYGMAPPPRHYWYDARSGLYGAWGYEAAGFIRPGHNFGPLAANASHGNTGVFINGRELNMTEAMYLQRLYGAVYQGRWWFDGTTGNVGVEGNPTPIFNVVAALQQKQARSSDSYHRWRNDSDHSTVTAKKGCVFVSVPGASGTNIYSNPSC